MSQWPKTICIVGAGSIGGLLGLRLALSGRNVTLIARGEHYNKMKSENGAYLIEKDGTERFCEIGKDIEITNDMDTCGTFDLVILAVKAHQIDPIAESIAKLADKDESVILPLQNGIPWWYFYNHGGEYDGYQLSSIDPTKRLWNTIPLEKIVGCLSFAAAKVPCPGKIQHTDGIEFPIGEPNRTISTRCNHIKQCFEQAGFKVPIKNDIRCEIWLKLLGNICFNPISVLAKATVYDIAEYQPTREVCEMVMKETKSIALSIGIQINISPTERINRARDYVGHHKTSMLQDYENKKPLELTIMKAVVEISKLTKTNAPGLAILTACVSLASANN